MNRSSRLLSLAVMSTLVSCAILGTAERPGAPKIDGLGNHVWKITTRSPEAQTFFTQGMQLIYAFDHGDAARSFRAALEADPVCAMCAWGLAYAMGPNVNNPNPANRQESARFQARADQLAKSAKDATPLELALIRAANGRYVSLMAKSPAAGADNTTSLSVVPVASVAPAAQMCTSGKSTIAPAFDLAYAQRMEALYKQFNTHPDVATLYADAELITDSWKWWGADGKPTVAAEKAVNALESTLKITREHTGANHLLIHALEQSPKPDRAMASADLLRSLASGAPHLLHMPSHIYIKTGRFADATLANQTALLADDKRVEIVKAQGYEAKSNWQTHHLHFLQYAAMMDGRSRIAIEASTKFAKLYSGKDASNSTFAQYVRALPSLNQARFQQWDAILATPMGETKDGIEEGLSRYARGLALTARGNAAEAQNELKEIRRLGTIDKNRTVKLFGENNVATLLQVMSETLDGQLKLKSQQTDEGIAALQRAVKLEATLEADDPPLLGAQTRLMLGRALLSAGRHSEAESVAREDLKAIPGSGWSLAVLRDAIRAQNKTTELAEIEKKLRDAWGRADAGLTSAQSTTGLTKS
jgi:tetratricopeptide (TPR) repeat protein